MSLSPVARSSTFTQSLLLAAVGVTALGQTLVFTLLPSLGRATGLAEIQVGLIISCSSLAFALASPVWGYLSELYGRRPILIIGLSGYATGTLLFALVFQAGLAGWVSGGVLVALLVAARMSQAVIMAATPPTSPRRRRAPAAWAASAPPTTWAPCWARASAACWRRWRWCCRSIWWPVWWP